MLRGACSSSVLRRAWRRSARPLAYGPEWGKPQPSMFPHQSVVKTNKQQPEQKQAEQPVGFLNKVVENFQLYPIHSVVSVLFCHELTHLWARNFIELNLTSFPYQSELASCYVYDKNLRWLRLPLDLFVAKEFVQSYSEFSRIGPMSTGLRFIGRHQAADEYMKSIGEPSNFKQKALKFIERYSLPLYFAWKIDEFSSMAVFWYTLKNNGTGKENFTVVDYAKDLQEALGYPAITEYITRQYASYLSQDQYIQLFEKFIVDPITPLVFLIAARYLPHRFASLIPLGSKPASADKS